MSGSTLGRWYRRNRVGYKKPAYHISNGYSDEEMLEMQQQFTMTLIRYMYRPRYEIIFIDESSCHAWNKTVRMWLHQDRPHRLNLPPTRGSGVAILAGISNRQPQLRYVTSNEGSNAHSYRQLLESLIDWPRELRRTVVVMDGATYHRNPWCREFLIDRGVSTLFLPPSSSNLNPIEKVWASYKRRLLINIALMDHEAMVELNFPATVRRTLEEFTQDFDGRVIVRSVLRSLEKVLDGQIV